MRVIQKISIILVAGWMMGIFLNGAFKGNTLDLLKIPQVFAEDEKKDQNKSTESDDKKNSEGNKDVKSAGSEEDDPCPECPECPDPAKVVLRGLEEKRTQVDREHKAMIEERKQLQVFEEQIDEKLENLKALEKQIKEDMALLDQKKTQKELEKEAQYEAQMRRLVKTYETMKPKAAAPIINQMNLEVAQEIFLRMKEKAASDILSFVDSEKAAKISERLAFKKR